MFTIESVESGSDVLVSTHTLRWEYTVYDVIMLSQ